MHVQTTQVLSAGCSGDTKHVLRRTSRVLPVADRLVHATSGPRVVAIPAFDRRRKRHSQRATGNPRVDRACAC